VAARDTSVSGGELRVENPAGHGHMRELAQDPSLHIHVRGNARHVVQIKFCRHAIDKRAKHNRTRPCEDE
jgi:hypothetical protein